MEHPYLYIIVSVMFAAVPLLVGVGTSYVKIHIVLSTLRHGLGTQNVPGPLILMSLSIALTMLIMQPVINNTEKKFDEFDTETMIKNPDLKIIRELMLPWKDFLFQHAGKRELLMFNSLHSPNDQEITETIEDISLETVTYSTLLPAFLVSELKEAFAMAFTLLLPFLVIDVLVSNILIGLGMYMVSPVFISLPLKIFLFVVADGWLLLARGLVRSYWSG